MKTFFSALLCTLFAFGFTPAVAGDDYNYGNNNFDDFSGTLQADFELLGAGFASGDDTSVIVDNRGTASGWIGYKDGLKGPNVMVDGYTDVWSKASSSGPGDSTAAAGSAGKLFQQIEVQLPDTGGHHDKHGGKKHGK